MNEDNKDKTFLRKLFLCRLLRGLDAANKHREQPLDNQLQTPFKGIVHPKVKFSSPFTHSQVVLHFS